MLVSSVNFCTVVLFCLCIGNLCALEVNNIISTTTPLSTDRKPDTNDVYDTDGFKGPSLTSGPLLIIDKRTIFISNLNYDGISDGQFWVGVGQPSLKGEVVPDENGSTSPLKSYKGKNIYLQLTGNLTTDQIDYLAIWSTTKKTDLGSVMLYQNVSYEVRNSVPEALGYHNKTKDNKTILRIPGCCREDEALENRTCIPADTHLEWDLPVLESNETHIDPDRNMSDIQLAIYKYNVICPEGYERFTLGKEEKPYLIYNGTLIYYVDAEYYGILPHGSFCAASHNENYIYLMCFPLGASTAGMNGQQLYFIFLIISAICFLGSAIVYIVLLKCKDVHRKCFVGYSISMTITFTALICLQKINGACEVMGGLFMFSLTCSFVWLTCLCLDMIFVVKKIKKCPEDIARIYIYTAVSLAFPSFILLCSLVPNGIPDVPHSFVKHHSELVLCEFKDADIKVFFIPIGLLILASLISLGYTSYIINTRNVCENYDFQKKRQNKFMLRSCILVWITTFIWLLEAFVSSQKMFEGIKYAIELIEALQGIFVVIIFVLNKYIRKEIIEALHKEENKKDDDMRFQALLKSLQKRRRGASESDNLN